MFYLQITIGQDANCLFNSILESMHHVPEDYTATHLRYQMIWNMASYPDTFEVNSFKQIHRQPAHTQTDSKTHTHTHTHTHISVQ